MAAPWKTAYALGGSNLEIHTIGDAARPRQVLEAI